jgi:hypothetical protein
LTMIIGNLVVSTGGHSCRSPPPFWKIPPSSGKLHFQNGGVVGHVILFILDGYTFLLDYRFICEQFLLILTDTRVFCRLWS